MTGENKMVNNKPIKHNKPYFQRKELLISVKLDPETKALYDELVDRKLNVSNWFRNALKAEFGGETDYNRKLLKNKYSQLVIQKEEINARLEKQIEEVAQEMLRYNSN